MSHAMTQNIPRRHDHLIKILLLGESGVGKSCCLLRFAEDSFTPSYITTIGIDFKIKIIEMDGKVIKLQIWDTAGQERFRSITVAYYRGAMGIMIVYDVTSLDSFNKVHEWFDTIKTHTTDNSIGPKIEPIKILVANKADVEESKRKVTYEMGKALADEYGVEFVEVSAKTGLNINKSFYTLTAAIKTELEKNADNEASDPSRVDLQQASPFIDTSKCC